MLISKSVWFKGVSGVFVAFCNLFLCLFFPDFEIISSCCKFSNYFRGRSNSFMIAFVGFGSGELRQGRDTYSGSNCAIEVVSH